MVAVSKGSSICEGSQIKPRNDMENVYKLIIERNVICFCFHCFSFFYWFKTRTSSQPSQYSTNHGHQTVQISNWLPMVDRKVHWKMRYEQRTILMMRVRARPSQKMPCISARWRHCVSSFTSHNLIQSYCTDFNSQKWNASELKRDREKACPGCDTLGTAIMCNSSEVNWIF